MVNIAIQEKAQRLVIYVDDSAILAAGARRFTEAGEVGWLDPDRDASARSLADTRRDG